MQLLKQCLSSEGIRVCKEHWQGDHFAKAEVYFGAMQNVWAR